MKTLGIIGGMSPESTISYYRQINRHINQAQGGNHSAPLLLDSLEFAHIVQLQQTGNWQAAGECLAHSAQKLQTMGAEGILLATNTMHKVADQIMKAIHIPFLHIIDATAQAIHAAQLEHVALLGTRLTMQDNFYRAALKDRGVQAITPNETQQAEIHRIIFEELCRGQCLPRAKAYYLEVIDDLAQQGAQGVILGCTEIGLLLSSADSHLPLFDTTDLHAQMAVDFILSS